MALIPVILYVLWNPALYLNTADMIQNLKDVSTTYRSPNSGHFSKTPGWEHFFYQMNEIKRTMPLFFEIAIIGIFLSFLNIKDENDNWKIKFFLNRKSILLLIFPVAYSAFMSQNYIAYHRNFFCYLLFFCLYSGYVFYLLVNILIQILRDRIVPLREKWIQTGMYTFGFICFYFFLIQKPYTYIAQLSSLYLTKDTRSVVIDWFNTVNDFGLPVAFAKELRISPADLERLNTDYLVFSQKNVNLDSLMAIFPFVVVGDYQSKASGLYEEDSVLNTKVKSLPLFFSISGNFMFRDEDAYFSDIDPKILILSRSFDSTRVVTLLNKQHVFPWNDTLVFPKNHLLPGLYSLSINAAGTSLERIFPAVTVLKMEKYSIPTSLLRSLSTKK